VGDAGPLQIGLGDHAERARPAAAEHQGGGGERERGDAAVHGRFLVSGRTGAGEGGRG
jgi:hypothetical protein